MPQQNHNKLVNKMIKELFLQTDYKIETLSQEDCIIYAKEITRTFMAYAHALDECVISQGTRRKITELARDLLVTRENTQ